MMENMEQTKRYHITKDMEAVMYLRVRTRGDDLVREEVARVLYFPEIEVAVVEPAGVRTLATFVDQDLGEQRAVFEGNQEAIAAWQSKGRYIIIQRKRFNCAAEDADLVLRQYQARNEIVQSLDEALENMLGPKPAQP